MQILVKVETGFNCNWRNIEPLQPEGFKGQTENEKETLKNSIVKNGFHDAFDVWKHDNKLLSIDGVHRKIALLELAAEGYEIPEQLPCTYVTAENETEAATIILSRNSQHSHIIRAAVLMEAYAIPAKMIEAVVPQKNLEAWSESDNSITEQLTAEEDDFEFEEGGIETDIVIGDLFEIGFHRLLCGDSTDSDAVAKLMNGEMADMVFTDPPWNVNYGAVKEGNAMGYKPRTIMNDSMSTADFKDFMGSAFAVMAMFSKKGCPTYVVMSAQEWGNLMLALHENAYHWSSTIIWNKSHLVMSRKDYHTKYEPIWYGWLGGSPRLCPVEDRKQSDVWDVDRPTKSELHPTTKPIALIDIALNNSSKQGNLIMELFTGSGSTMVASHQLNRKCYGMELDPKYCQVIIDRMRKLDPTLIIKRNGVIYE